jgi:phosphoglycerate dehydrogenase-like enzyme
MPTVLVTPETLFHAPGRYLELLHSAGFEVHYPPRQPLTGEAETIVALEGAAAVIAGGEPYTERVLRSLPGLRVIARMGVGYDRVDVEAATRSSVVLAVTATTNHEAVAELALALILALAKRIVKRNQEVREGIWSRTPPEPLRGKTLGLLGVGRIARSLAKRAAALRMNLLGHDKYPDPAAARAHGVELVELDALLGRSDYLSLHAPLTPETRGFIDRRVLSRMKPGSVLINTARGDLVVEEDLYEALRSGHLAGAGLDVFCEEPTPVTNPLLRLENVIALPHQAGVDALSREEMAAESAQNIIDLHQGRWPEAAIVNRSLRSDWKW